MWVFYSTKHGFSSAIVVFKFIFPVKDRITSYNVCYTKLLRSRLKSATTWRLSTTVVSSIGSRLAESPTRKVYLDGVSFKLFQKDRNTIYRIQFAREKTISHWFLKMSRSKNPEMARREILGAEVVRKALGSVITSYSIHYTKLYETIKV